MQLASPTSRSRAGALVAVGVGLSILLSCDDAPSTRATGYESVSATQSAEGDASAEPGEYCGDPAIDSTIRTSTSASGDFTVTLTRLPASVSSNELVAFGVEVDAAVGIHTEYLDILVDAGMPQHGHGMSVRPVHRSGVADGEFEVDGMLFHMPGAWELYVDVIDGPYTERVTFHVLAR